MTFSPRFPKQAPLSPPPVNDKPFSAGCVLWFAIVGCVLTMLVLTAGKSASLFSLSRFFSASTSTPATLPELETAILSGTRSSHTYYLEVARTNAARQQGLSDRLSLPEGTGMHFIFDAPGNPSFWMHGMRFPLDMVFVNAGKIVNIANNVPFPKTATEEPVTIHPQQLYTDVLELKAGEADRLGLKIGQTIQLLK